MALLGLGWEEKEGKVEESYKKELRTMEGKSGSNGKDVYVVERKR